MKRNTSSILKYWRLCAEPPFFEESIFQTLVQRFDTWCRSYQDMFSTSHPHLTACSWHCFHSTTFQMRYTKKWCIWRLEAACDKKVCKGCAFVFVYVSFMCLCVCVDKLVHELNMICVDWDLSKILYIYLYLVYICCESRSVSDVQAGVAQLTSVVGISSMFGSRHLTMSGKSAIVLSMIWWRGLW